MNHKLAVKLACEYSHGKWPNNLSCGVMVYSGHRITVDEFKDYARRSK